MGLRQLCDLAVFIHSTQERIDFDELQSNLKKIGLEEFFQAMMNILVEQLGLVLKGTKLKSQKSTLANKILKDINDGGNFGKAVEENRILVILRHYIKYLPNAPKEILYIPYEKFTRKWRGFTS